MSAFTRPISLTSMPGFLALNFVQEIESVLTVAFERCQKDGVEQDVFATDVHLSLKVLSRKSLLSKSMIELTQSFLKDSDKNALFSKIATTMASALKPWIMSHTIFSNPDAWRSAIEFDAVVECNPAILATENDRSIVLKLQQVGSFTIFKRASV